jgi:hypothetical protein
MVTGTRLAVTFVSAFPVFLVSAPEVHTFATNPTARSQCQAEGGPHNVPQTLGATAQNIDRL